MPHTRVIEQLKQNLQTAYRQAIDADAKLDELKKRDMASLLAYLANNKVLAPRAIALVLTCRSLHSN